MFRSVINFSYHAYIPSINQILSTEPTIQGLLISEIIQGLVIGLTIASVTGLTNTTSAGVRLSNFPFTPNVTANPIAFAHSMCGIATDINKVLAFNINTAQVGSSIDINLIKNGTTAGTSTNPHWVSFVLSYLV